MDTYLMIFLCFSFNTHTPLKYNLIINVYSLCMLRNVMPLSLGPQPMILCMNLQHIALYLHSVKYVLSFKFTVLITHT